MYQPKAKLAAIIFVMASTGLIASVHYAQMNELHTIAVKTLLMQNKAYTLQAQQYAMQAQQFDEFLKTQGAKGQ